VACLKVQPLSYKGIIKEGDSKTCVLELTIGVLSSQHEDMNFKVLIQAVDSTNNNKIANLFICSEPVQVISKPDVFKSPASDTYVIFGEANIEDPGSHLLKETAKQFEKKRQDAAGNGDEPPALEPVEAPEAVDETGVEEKDIELVMSQTSATRSQAVSALKKTGGDIVNAIMELAL